MRMSVCVCKRELFLIFFFKVGKPWGTLHQTCDYLTIKFRCRTRTQRFFLKYVFNILSSKNMHSGEGELDFEN